MKPNKPLKTVRIKEPGDELQTEVVSIEPARESSALTLVSDSAQVQSPILQASTKTTANRSSIIEGETLVKSILKNDTATTVFVTQIEMKIPNEGEMSVAHNTGEKRRSVYENVDVSEINVIIEEPDDGEDNYENDTFHLAKDSALFSQVSRSTIITSPTVICKQEDNPCKVVEVKAKEIVKATVRDQVVLPEKSDHEGPQTVEIVELVDDTETEAESSAADTDPEDRWPSPVTERKVDGSHKQRKTCLAPGEILLKRQKLASSEAMRSVLVSGGNVKIENNVENTMSENRDTLSINRLLTKCDELASKGSMEQSQFTFISTCPTSLMVPDNKTTPLYLQMTDTINRVEQATVKTFDRGVPKDRDLDISKELTLRKEVEVSKTYKIIGNIKKQSEVPSGLTGSVGEDNDSFYGSDKETDDIIMFSEDEGHVDFDDDTSSSDNDFLSSLSQEADDLCSKVGVYINDFS